LASELTRRSGAGYHQKMKWLRWPAAVALAVAALTVAAQGLPLLKPEALELLKRGVAHFERGELAAANEAFDAGNRLDPHPIFLYSRAQVTRVSGDCATAIKLYEAFLATAPAPRQAEAARLNIERCRLSLPPTSTAAAPPASTSAVALTAAGGRVEPAPPWWRDRAGGILVGSGLTLAASGLTVWSLGRARASAARAATSYDDALAKLESARTGERMQWAGVTVIAAGSALIAGAITRYLYRHYRRAPARSLLVEARTGGGLVGIRHEF
jgi:hypothetical protein